MEALPSTVINSDKLIGHLFESGWLIGCDGAHSTVRHKLGLEFAGGTMPSRWIIADLQLSNVPSPEEILISWHAEGILAIFPIIAPRYRVIADAGLLHAGAAPASPTMEEVQTILDTRGPGGITASDPIWGHLTAPLHSWT